MFFHPLLHSSHSLSNSLHEIKCCSHHSLHLFFPGSPVASVLTIPRVISAPISTTLQHMTVAHSLFPEVLYLLTSKKLPSHSFFVFSSSSWRLDIGDSSRSDPGPLFHFNTLTERSHSVLKVYLYSDNAQFYNPSLTSFLNAYLLKYSHMATYW